MEEGSNAEDVCMSMFIRELTIENFKGFAGEHSFAFDQNFTYFVGDNNSGKSTIFESVEFLKSGLSVGKDISSIRNKSSDGGDVVVTAKLQGNIKNVIADFSESKYDSYVFEEDGMETLRARRTSRSHEINQGKKPVKIDVKKITLWNEETKQYENPAGPDTVFKTLFETQFVWADTNPDDISDFGSTKICGRLLNGVIGDFFETPQWNSFVEVHRQTFSEGADSLSSRTKVLQDRVQEVLLSQYGKAEVSFNFQLPDIANFIKSGVIDVNDGTKTTSREKGTGMQRALALALVQVYADELCKHPEDIEKKKPLFLFIDEPETFLHPKAQQRLLEALDVISGTQQVFVTTHSPYLLKSYNPANHALYMCTKDATTNKAVPSSDLSLFGASSPTWGEINYFAYGVDTVEFHNELYGFVQAKAIDEDPKYEKNDAFDDYLQAKGLTKDIDWTHVKVNGDKVYPVTLQTYIRNSIHHPENKKNVAYSSVQLANSIKQLITVLTT